MSDVVNSEGLRLSVLERVVRGIRGIEGEGAVGIEGQSVDGEGITGGILDVSGRIREEEGGVARGIDIRGGELS